MIPAESQHPEVLGYVGLGYPEASLGFRGAAVFLEKTTEDPNTDGVRQGFKDIGLPDIASFDAFHLIQSCG